MTHQHGEPLPIGHVWRARGLLFDMDGTLVDSTSVVESLWVEFAQRYDLDPGEVIRYAHGRQTPDTVARFLPPGEDPVVVVRWLEGEELHRLDGVVEVAGAARFLASLGTTMIGVVTSAPRQLALRRLVAAGIAPPDLLVTAEDVAKGKPSPEGYLRAASALGLLARECVVFEDAEAGLLAARAAGSPAVVVGGHVSPTTAGLPRIRDFVDLVVTVAEADGAALEISLPAQGSLPTTVGQPHQPPG